MQLIEVQYTRNCRQCDKKLYYKNKKSFKISEKKQTICHSCSSILKVQKNGTPYDNFVKKCGQQYVDDFLKRNSKKNGKILSKKIKGKTLEQIYGKEKAVEISEKLSKSKSGVNNAMYGKTIYGVWLEKYGKEMADEKLKELKLIMSQKSTGEKNGMYGKGHLLKGKTGFSLPKTLVKNYGKEIGEQKIADWKKKISKANKGKNNPMYGKPAPRGSGNGWSGWYKNWYFRSILELSYMIKIIERFNLMWESGEQKKFKIQYNDIDNIDRNYFVDFIINNKYLIELKPNSLINGSRVVKEKASAAEKWCKENGYIYKIKEIKKISFGLIKQLRDSGELQFLDRYNKKFEELLTKNVHI